MKNTTEHYRKLERMYVTSALNASFKPELTVSQAQARLSYVITPAHHHAAHSGHGAIIFKALDDAAFFAASSLNEACFMVTASFNIHYLRPIVDGELTAIAKVVNQSKRSMLVEVSARNNEDKLIARGTGSFMPSRMPLNHEVGYV